MGETKTQAVFDATAAHDLFHLISDVHHLVALFGFKDEIFGVCLHLHSISSRGRSGKVLPFRHGVFIAA